MSILVKDGNGTPRTVATNDDVIAMVATAQGQAAAQASAEALAGAVGEAAPASDTAPSGQNGRLQRLAQHLTSLIARLPAALTGSGNLKVALVESTVPQKVIGQATWTKTTITLTGNSDQLLAANAARVGFIVVNRVGNAQIDVDIAGGTVAANTGRPIFAGNDYFFTGVYCPTGIVTVKGTSGQIVNVWEAV